MEAWPIAHHLHINIPYYSKDSNLYPNVGFELTELWEGWDLLIVYANRNLDAGLSLLNIKLFSNAEYSPFVELSE